MVVEARVMPITVEATYENETLKLSGPLPLREHEKVRVTVEPQIAAANDDQANVAGSEATGPTIAEEILALARELPPGALDSLPDDLAAEHDHYLYGTPKRFE
jgi:predicted DNA-binding antitoxin AbrB/MazE fold protein